MIYVDEKQLLQVEYLLEQSSRGHHVLFDTDTIRSVFSLSQSSLTNASEKASQVLGDSSELSEDEDEDSASEKHLENLIMQPTLDEKRAYLKNLPKEVFENLIKTYFAIVENNIIQESEYQQ